MLSLSVQRPPVARGRGGFFFFSFSPPPAGFVMLPLAFGGFLAFLAFGARRFLGQIT